MGSSIRVFINLNERHRKKYIHKRNWDEEGATEMQIRGEVSVDRDSISFFTVWPVFLELFSFPFLIIEPLIPNYCY